MSLQYFNHEYASNSDLKRLMNKYVHDKEEPENLDEIFKEGTLHHAVLFEPHKADVTHPKYQLAKDMAKTILADDLCRQFIMMPDFKREHEWYRYDVFGIKGRAKMDGSSKAISTIMEYKGLKISTQNAFYEAIDRFDYDMGAVWYLNASKYKQILIPAVSKVDPRKLFKELIDRDHKMYKHGEIKAKRAVEVWMDFFPETIKRVA